VRNGFIADYETEFGTGTAWTESELLVTNSRVKGIGRFALENTHVRTGADDGGARASLPRRDIIDPMTGVRVSVEVYRGLGMGQEAVGPLLIEEPDTTIYVPEFATVHRDGNANYIVDLKKAQARGRRN